MYTVPEPVCRFYNFELRKTPCPNLVTHVVYWWDSETWYACEFHANHYRELIKDNTINRVFVAGVWSLEELRSGN